MTNDDSTERREPRKPVELERPLCPTGAAMLDPMLERLERRQQGQRK
jgi:hypothetical protein